jgi:hypothetical protein
MFACSNLDQLKQWLTLAVGGHDAELQEQVSKLKTSTV